MAWLVADLHHLDLAAACAEGQTLITGAEELRVKESDRIQSMVDGLNALGVAAEARVVDAATERNASHAWSDWGPRLLWMSVYFSLGVWSSIALVNAPRAVPVGQKLDPDHDPAAAAANEVLGVGTLVCSC